jgi:molybdate transport system permease protein
MGSLFYFIKSSLIHEALLSKRILFSIRLSLYTAALASFISVALGIPAAYALSRFDFPGKKMVDTLLELPLVVSPAAFGAMLLIFFNTPFGNWLQERGIRFAFEVRGIVLAQVVTTMGIATRLIKAVMDEIPQRYEDVARSLGASHAKAFVTITLPLSRRGIVASWGLTWARALGEFGATITLAGSMAMKTETLPIAIFMKLSTADIEGTVVLILILVAVGLGILYGVRFLSRESTHA